MISSNENSLSKEVNLMFFFLTLRLGIKACVVIIPFRGVTWLFVSSTKFLLTSSPYSNLLSSVFDSNSQKSFNLDYIFFLLTETPLHWLHNIFCNCKNKEVLTMQEKTDFIFIYRICNSLPS